MFTAAWKQGNIQTDGLAQESTNTSIAVGTGGRWQSRWWNIGRRAWRSIFLPWAKLPVCQRPFQYIAYLKNDILAGKHVYYELQQLTLHDKARIGYAERLEADFRVMPHLEEPGKPVTPKQLSSGWALKQTKKSKRFSKNKTKQTKKNNQKKKQKQTKNKTKQNKKTDSAEKVPSRNGMWKKSVNRVKLSETCKEQKEIVESSYFIILRISLSNK